MLKYFHPAGLSNQIKLSAGGYANLFASEFAYFPSIFTKYNQGNSTLLHTLFFNYQNG